MIKIEGYWYDGKRSARVAATCLVRDDGTTEVRRQDDGSALYRAKRFRARLSPRLANTPRHISFPSGKMLETEDFANLAVVEKRFTATSWLSHLHSLESRKRYIALCLLLLIAFILGAWRFGIPFAAKFIAWKLPVSAYRLADKQTLAALDKTILAPSQLEPAVERRLRDHFAPIIDSHADWPLRILFRKGGQNIAANAFALPHGTIIFTDEMVALAHHDDELVTILAHEIGHVVKRHGMRTMIQDSLLAFLLFTIAGDAAGTSELFLGLPVLLTQMAYSREFEREADRYALTYLESNHIAPNHFANLLGRIQAKLEAEKKDSGSGVLKYFSTHPDMDARIKMFQNR